MDEINTMNDDNATKKSLFEYMYNHMLLLKRKLLFMKAYVQGT